VRPSDASVAAELEERRLRAMRERVLALAEGLAATVTLRAGGADAVVIRCEDADPSKAAQVCNGLTRLLVEEAARERASGAEGALQALDAQLAEARQILEKKADALRRLRAEEAEDSGAGHDANGLQKVARDYDQAWNAYRALLERWRAADTASRTGHSGRVRFLVLRPAPVPATPCYPNRVLFALVGAALGLVFGLGAAVAAERRNPSIKGPEDLMQLLPQPILAEVPLVRIRGSRRVSPARRRSRRA
jgi:uncharacterized protein involved in exopolysaccharide biosynthesis